MTRKRRRMIMVLAALVLLGGAAALVLTALQENLVYFHSPSDIAEKPPAPGQSIRLGGLVAEDSLEKLPDGLTFTFVITDLAEDVPVVYKGLLPDLFREGQGVVAEGKLEPGGLFRASEVLAKHDETYMPPEVAAALKEAGQWQPDAQGDAKEDPY